MDRMLGRFFVQQQTFGLRADTSHLGQPRTWKAAIVAPGGGSSASSAPACLAADRHRLARRRALGAVLGVAAERKPLEMVIRPYVID